MTRIEQKYIENHPKSAERYAKSRNIFANGVTHDARNLRPFPYYVTHSDKAHKWDVDGNKIIDYWTGHGSLLLGHNHPAVVNAVRKQVGIGTHFSASTDLEIKWAQLITELVPCGEKVRFNSSGTEADMMAIRIARAYTGRSKVIKFKDHFHGWSDYASAGNAGAGGIPDETLSTMLVLPPNEISYVEDTIKKNDVAAVILEPTGAHMGRDPIKPKFLEQIRQVTKQYDVVLIFDEVVTGFRTSQSGASGYFGVTPDLSTHAKIMGGGLPGGCVTGKTDLIDMIQLREDPDFNNEHRVGHNGTYNANPLSAVAGITALEHVRDSNVNETADKMGKRLKQGLNDLMSKMEVTGFASGIGSMVFLRVGVEAENEYHLTPEQCNKLSTSPINTPARLAMYNHGVDGWDRFILSAAHTEHDIDQTVDAVAATFKDLRDESLL